MPNVLGRSATIARTFVPRVALREDGTSPTPARGATTDRPRLTTADLPATPQRDFLIPAERWIEAPDELRVLGADIGIESPAASCCINRYLLWRAGPVVKANARYMAIAQRRSRRAFDVPASIPSGAGEGAAGPDGRVHASFRRWKEALRDAVLEDVDESAFAADRDPGERLRPRPPVPTIRARSPACSRDGGRSRRSGRGLDIARGTGMSTVAPADHASTRWSGSTFRRR